MADAATKKQRATLVSNILAIIGFIILIVILIWGLFHLAIFSKSWFASMVSPSANSIKVTVPSSGVPSGEPVTISWKYSAKDKGAYAFLYQCHTGFQFKTPGTSDSLNLISCGAAYNLQSTKSSLSVTPFFNDNGISFLNVPLSIIFIPTAATGTRAQGNASITVVKSSPQVSTLPATYTPPSKTYNAGMQPAGMPDLYVQILSYGVIEPVSGNIIPRRPTSPNDLVAVKFDIANTGGAPTGAWYFTAQLPTVPIYTYLSDSQNSLAPGAHIQNMLRFTQTAQGGGSFVVSVDPSNLINESNEGNNTASQSI